MTENKTYTIHTQAFGQLIHSYRGLKYLGLNPHTSIPFADFADATRICIEKDHKGHSKRRPTVVSIPLRNISLAVEQK